MPLRARDTQTACEWVRTSSSRPLRSRNHKLYLLKFSPSCESCVCTSKTKTEPSKCDGWHWLYECDILYMLYGISYALLWGNLRHIFDILAQQTLLLELAKLFISSDISVRNTCIYYRASYSLARICVCRKL